jgi:hypothetical protein
MTIENAPQDDLTVLKSRIKILLAISTVAGLAALYPFTQFGTYGFVTAMAAMPVIYLVGLLCTIFLAITTVKARRIVKANGVATDRLLGFAHEMWILGVVVAGLAALPTLFILMLIGVNSGA